MAELWHYPVKSLRGEQLTRTRLEGGGIVGDRIVYVRDLDSGRVVTSRIRPDLLALQGSLDQDGEPTVDTHPWRSSTALALVREAAGNVELVRTHGRGGGERYDSLPLTILTDGAVAHFGFDRRRFRPNVFITGVPGLSELAWAHSTMRLGAIQIHVARRIGRCVMTTFNPDTLEQDRSVLRRVVDELDGRLALECVAEFDGWLNVGDVVYPPRP